MSTRFMVALSLIVAASPVAASSVVPAPATPAPAGTPDTKYCMRVEPVTGSRLETIQCWTREEWAEQGVDVDEDWATEGVAVVG